MVKKIVLIISLFLMVTALVNCSGGKYSVIESKEKVTITSTEMTYSSFKGRKYKTVKLKAFDKLKLDIDVITKEGTLKIALVDDEGNELFSVETPNDHVTENIIIPKQGVYYIEVSGEHSGSYEINWDVIQ